VKGERTLPRLVQIWFLSGSCSSLSLGERGRFFLPLEDNEYDVDGSAISVYRFVLLI
jgi:hypothetical protein